MNKSQEIEILRETAKKLGPNSYCGLWLDGIADEVLAEIRSDFMPSPSIARAQKEADEVRAAARAEADQIINTARDTAEIARVARLRSTNKKIDELVYALQNHKFVVSVA